MRALAYLIPQEWAQLTGTCEHPKTSPGGEEAGWIHRSPGALGLGPCGNMHPHSTHTHSVFPASCLPQPRDPGNLRHIPIDLKNKRKSYTSIFHSLKKCFKKLCTGGGGWEPCPGSDGRRAAVSQPAPWFQPWSCCLLIFMFLKANTLRRHARTHARTPTILPDWKPVLRPSPAHRSTALLE